VDQFIDRRDVKRTLALHPFDGSDYYLGAFLLGAYQEILGDLHNLFGDTNTVHVRLGETGEIILDSVISKAVKVAEPANLLSRDRQGAASVSERHWAQHGNLTDVYGHVRPYTDIFILATKLAGICQEL
jgi:arginine decarboxylase